MPENPNPPAAHNSGQAAGLRSVARRKFLIRSAGVLGAAVLTCAGLGFVATRRPRLNLPEPISCGGSTEMNGKILIAYATRCGSTAEVADAIGKVFCERGAAVDVLPLKEVRSLDGYAGFVLGSAIRFGAWLPEAAQFVEQNLARLKQAPTAFFTVHLNNTADDEASKTARLAYLEPIRKLVPPAAEAFFAGVGDFSKVNFLERLMAKMVKSPEGDFRDWQKIRGWAEEIQQTAFAPA